MADQEQKPHKFAAQITQWLQDPTGLRFWFYSHPGEEWREVEPRHVMMAPHYGMTCNYTHLCVAAEKPTERPRRMCTIDGAFSYPEPERKEPQHGAVYWYPCLHRTGPGILSSYWDSDNADLHLLSHGFVHLSQECALAHATALAFASTAAFNRLESEQ